MATSAENLPWQTRFQESLDQAERHILIMRYRDELSATEIGIVFDITASHVLGLLRKLVRRARSYRRIEALNRGEV